MVYSTCTFAVDEDEGQMQRFVEKHPEMRLIESEKIYPHRQKGEGHFVALLEKVSLSPLQAQKTVRIKERHYLGVLKIIGNYSEILKEMFFLF